MGEGQARIAKVITQAIRTWARRIPRRRDGLRGEPCLVAYLASMESDHVTNVGRKERKLGPNPNLGDMIIYIHVGEEVGCIAVFDTILVDNQEHWRQRGLSINRPNAQQRSGSNCYPTGPHSFLHAIEFPILKK